MPLLFLTALLFGLLIYSTYHDIRYRTLPVSVPIFIGVVMFLRSVVCNGLQTACIYAGVNLCILAFQFLLLTVYFSAKKGQWLSIVNTYVGAGDLFFYGALIFCFSPFNFVFFNASSCLLIIMFYLFKARKIHIPLAGYLSLFLLITYTAAYFFKHTFFYDDTFLMTRLPFFNGS